MQTIKVKAPAKINLMLEVLNRREDGYHNIESIMQSVSLYDYLTINVDNSSNIREIKASGNNPLIPYDKTNLVFKSAEKFLNKAGITDKIVDIYIEKHIPVAAGLAGGSADAAAVLYGLNKIFNNTLNQKTISSLASEIGADVNFCLHGGTKIATLKGEKLKSVDSPKLNLIIVKPKNLFISAKEAYDKYAKLENKPAYQQIEKMIQAIAQNSPEAIASFLHNGLEYSILPDYEQVRTIKESLIKSGCLNAIMSGSGPSVFGILPDNRQIVANFENCDVFYANTLNSGIIDYYTGNQ